jgi:uncharacterized membrane protein YbhN (UPF0104 family)
MQKDTPSGKAWYGYAGLLLGFILIGYLFSRVDLKSSAALIGSIGYLSILIPLPYLLLHLLETAAWKKLFSDSIRQIRFFRLLKIQIVSETVSMTLPAGVAVGEPLRPYLCRRFMDVPLPAGFASIAVRKLLLGATQGIYTTIGAVTGFSLLQHSSQGVAGFEGLGVIMVLAGTLVMLFFLFMLALLLNGKAARSLHRLLMLIPFPRVRQWLLAREEGFTQTDRELQNLRNTGFAGILPLLAYYTAAWMMLALESYLILRLLGVHVSFIQVLAFDTALAMLRAVFFFVPSGLGIQDLGYLAFFQALGMHDYLVYGGAFVVLRRLKELVWYAAGYALMFIDGIHLKDAQRVTEKSE